MNTGEKFFLFFIILIVDWVFFLMPLTAIFAGYIIFFRPLWFRDWLLGLYDA